MQDIKDERRITYGLRTRAGGLLLRVEPEADLTGDNESPSASIVYRFTTDPSFPVYDAGSAERLAGIFASPYPGSEENPYKGDFKPETVEPVLIEETVTRRIRPTAIAFDVPLRVETYYTLDLDRRMAKNFDGATEILDVIEAVRDELDGLPYPGSSQTWGKHNIVGIIILQDVSDLPEGYQGRLVAKRSDDMPRRALTAIPLPEKMLANLGADKSVRSASVMVCLSDMRPAPDGLLETLRELSSGSAPGPR